MRKQIVERGWGLLLAWVLCGGASAFAGQSAPSESHAELYRRATNSFAAAEFYKPAQTNTEDLVFKLAPLILQERAGHSEGRGAEFGRLSLVQGEVVLERSRPTVYVQADMVDIHGQAHPRFTYLWFYAVASTQGLNGAAAVQGVRLTLNAQGAPAIWEVLSEPTGAELVFVARSAESAAAEDFGAVLPGRRQAVERGLTEAPQTVVPRIVEDGPVPMGPMVYLMAGTRAVSTVACRCMPAQAKRLAGTRTYELVLVGTAEAPAALLKQAQGRAAFWLGEGRGSFEAKVRLPRGF